MKYNKGLWLYDITARFKHYAPVIILGLLRTIGKFFGGLPYDCQTQFMEYISTLPST